MWWHFHKFKLVKRELINLTVTLWGTTLRTGVHGLKVLEKCECGEHQAYYMDDNGEKRFKVPEIIFPEHFNLN